jgi:hypothetical protein
MFNPALHDARGAEQQVSQSFAAKQRGFGAATVSGCQMDTSEQFGTAGNFGDNGFHRKLLYGAVHKKHRIYKVI